MLARYRPMYVLHMQINGTLRTPCRSSTANMWYTISCRRIGLLSVVDGVKKCRTRLRVAATNKRLNQQIVADINRRSRSRISHLCPRINTVYLIDVLRLTHTNSFSASLPGESTRENGLFTSDWRTQTTTVMRVVKLQGQFDHISFHYLSCTSSYIPPTVTIFPAFEKTISARLFPELHQSKYYNEVYTSIRHQLPPFGATNKIHLVFCTQYVLHTVVTDIHIVVIMNLGKC